MRMNSERYFSIVEERLNTISVRVERLGRLNLHDININAEYFFMHLLNLLFKRHLTNINSQTPNAPGVDLADYEKKGDLASILNCYVRKNSAINIQGRYVTISRI